MSGRQLYITGYGQQDEAPSPEVFNAVENVHVVRPGQRILLQAAQLGSKGAAAAAAYTAVHGYMVRPVGDSWGSTDEKAAPQRV